MMIAKNKQPSVDKHADTLFSPALMDRIDGSVYTVSQAKMRRTTDVATVRDIIRRDLALLFNTMNAGTFLEAQGYPELKDSLLNYGIDAIAGHYLEAHGWHAIEAMLRRAILLFEPRIMADSLIIRPVQDEKNHVQVRHNLRFDVSAHVVWQGEMIDFYVQSLLDVETAHMSLQSMQEVNR
jgi:type VI secretion system protein ImpF